MKTKVFLLHGFNIKDGGKATVLKLVPYFEERGAEVVDFAYGYFNIFMPRWRNPEVAQKLAAETLKAKLAGYRVVLVGHSNGCTIIHMAGEKFGAKADKVVYINPALNRAVSFPDGFTSFDVWHSPGDRITRLARWMPLNLWGDMGAVGFTKHDPRGTNLNAQTNFEQASKRHSTVFSDSLIDYFGPRIVARSVL